MMREFLERIWGHTEGWAFLAYAGGGQFKHRAYKYPNQLELLLNDAKELNGWADVYFTPHLFNSNRNRTRDAAISPLCLWADKDAGPVEDFKPKPTICWRTSEGKHQAVWVLKEPADPARAERVNRFLTYATKSDKGGWYLGKVIRFPESVNYKYHPPFKGILLWNNGPTYDIADLEPADTDALDRALAEASQVKTPKMPKGFPGLTDSLITYGPRIPTGVWELLKREPSPGEDWSEELWKMERLLCEAGVPPEHVFSIVRESPWNKYKRDDRPEEHLWAEVYKASLEKGPFQETPEELPWVGMDELMLYTEKPSWLVEDIWTKKNVGWIAGVGKSYKSVLSLDLALSVASGKPFLGKYRVTDPGPVLMVQEEDPVWRVANRIQTMCLEKGISQVSVSDSEDALILEFKGAKIPLFASVGGGMLFTDETKTAALERAIDRYRPKLIVLDPMFMLSAGLDEYKSGDMVEALNLMKRWRNDYGCAIAVIHHYRKGSGSSIERLYGSMALYAWSENSLFVSRAEGNIVVVERDIKDALLESKISVEFLDIDESYDFKTEELAVGAGRVKGSAEDKVVAFLTSGEPGDKVSRKEITQATGLAAKTISTKISELEKDGLVLTEYTGKGGQMFVLPLADLWKKKGREGMVDFGPE